MIKHSSKRLSDCDACQWQDAVRLCHRQDSRFQTSHFQASSFSLLPLDQDIFIVFGDFFFFLPFIEY